MEAISENHFLKKNNKVKRALITDDCHPILIEGLVELGFECDFEPNISLLEVRGKIADYEGLVVNSKILVNRSFLEIAKKLEFIARLGSGMEIIDREFAKERGVAVFSSPEGNCNAVAEQALGMLLSLANNLLRSDRQVRQKIWQREANRGWELRGKTVGIIGFGHTGSAFARKLAGFEVEVLAFDKYKTNYTEGFQYVRVATIEEIFEKSDIISLHLPLTAETMFLADASFFEKCKTGVVIINTSRGKCLRTSDLLVALHSGKVRGACLDVFENEKPETFSPAEHAMFDTLYRMENVVLSPHIAGWTQESKYLLAAILLAKIKNYLIQNR